MVASSLVRGPRPYFTTPATATPSPPPPRAPRFFFSFCIVKNQPECHYSSRLPGPPKASAKTKPAGTGPPQPHQNAAASRSTPPSIGKSFWQTDEERAARAATKPGKGKRSRKAARGGGGGGAGGAGAAGGGAAAHDPPQLLPLKRYTLVGFVSVFR